MAKSGSELWAGNRLSRSGGTYYDQLDRGEKLIQVCCLPCCEGWDGSIDIWCCRNGKYARENIQIVCPNLGYDKLPLDEWYYNIKHAVAKVLENTEPEYDVRNYWF